MKSRRKAREIALTFLYQWDVRGEEVLPEMDDLLDRIERELDFDRRKALWARLQQIYAEDLPVLPLYWRANTYVLPKWLEGVRPTGHQFTSTLWVEEWRRGAR